MKQYMIAFREQVLRALAAGQSRSDVDTLRRERVDDRELATAAA